MCDMMLMMVSIIFHMMIRKLSIMDRVVVVHLMMLVVPFVLVPRQEHFLRPRIVILTVSRLIEWI